MGVESVNPRLSALEIRGSSMPCPYCGKEIKINIKVAEIEFVKEVKTSE